MPAGDVLAPDAIREGRRVKARALAGYARCVLAVAREQDPDVHLVHARLEPREPRAHSWVLAAVPAALAVDDERPLLGRELLPGDRQGDLPLRAELVKDPPLPGRARAAPGLYRACPERLRRIGDDPVPVDGDDPSEPAARVAGAEGRIVGEEAGPRGIEGARALWADEAARHRHVRASSLGAEFGASPAARPRCFDGLLETACLAWVDADAIDHDLEANSRGGGLARAHVVDLAHRARDHDPPVAVFREGLSELEELLGVVHEHAVRHDRASPCHGRRQARGRIARRSVDRLAIAIGARRDRLPGEE